MTTIKKPFQLGSISTGTLRKRDLLSAFTQTLQTLDSGELRNLEAAKKIDEPNVAEYLDWLTDALNELCPPFVYFGTHPGDGADFGFWPDMDRLNEAMQSMGMASESDEERLEDDGVIVQVSDHGNVTVMDMDRNVLWSVV